MRKPAASICFILLLWKAAQVEGAPGDLLRRTSCEVTHALARNDNRGLPQELLYRQEPGDVAFWKIDEYGALSSKEERKRLDEFARRLRGQPSTKAYIIAYGGHSSWPNEARDSANCVKDYLVKKQGISNRRIVTVDGGYQSEAAVALYMGEHGDPPLATPTVDPRNVRIIKGYGQNRQRGVCLPPNRHAGSGLDLKTKRQKGNAKVSIPFQLINFCRLYIAHVLYGRVELRDSPLRNAEVKSTKQGTERGHLKNVTQGCSSYA
jgi:hypothetical protein